MIKKNDFVEIEFSGRVKGGEIFDTTLKQEAEKLGIRKDDVKPLIVCAGQGMLVSGCDKALEGKETGKEYTIELSPRDAFGERNRDLIKTIPLRVFLEKEINPLPGLVLALDNMLVKIIAVSGGRVTTDFNNPLAGKIIAYQFKVLRKIESLDEKINSFLDFFLKKKFEFEIREKTVVFKVDDRAYESAVGMFNGKFREIFNLEMAFEEKQKAQQTEENKVEKIEKEAKEESITE